MKVLRILLWLLLLMVAGSLLWQVVAADPGLVVVRLRGYDLTTTVPVAALLLLLLGAALWLVLTVLRIPFRVWTRYTRRRARARLSDGLMALHEGRWLRGQKLLEKAADETRVRTPALLAAARAARARGDEAGADQLLELAARDRGKNAVALERARLAMQAGRTDEALARLDEIDPRIGIPPESHYLRAQALSSAGRASEALALVATLRRNRVLTEGAADAFERGMQARALQQAGDAAQLHHAWEQVHKTLRTEPEVVAAFARRAMALGLEDRAGNAIEAALAQQWSEPLVAIYGELPRPRSGSRLSSAESWLTAHPASPALLVTLGRLCREQGLWGKAEEYLHRAIAQGASGEAWEVLGHCFVGQGDDKRARQAYANALSVRAGQRATALSGRSLREQIQDEAVPEDRDAHGVPRLRG